MPETTSGGMALKFYASQRMDMRRIENLKQGDLVIGSRARVTVVKNKVAAPFKKAEFDVLYGEGISKVGEILDLGVAADIITKRGAFFSYGEIRFGQGRENSKSFLKQNPDLAAEIGQKIREFGSGSIGNAAADEGEEE